MNAQTVEKMAKLVLAQAIATSKTRGGLRNSQTRQNPQHARISLAELVSLEYDSLKTDTEFNRGWELPKIPALESAAKHAEYDGVKYDGSELKTIIIDGLAHLINE